MRRQRRVAVSAVVLVALIAAGLSACSKDDGPDATVKAFLAGWPTGQFDKVGFLAATGAAIPAADVAKEIKSLSGELATKPIKLVEVGKATVTKDDATAAVTVDWAVADGVTWHYQTTVRLHHQAETWAVVWTPETLAKGLQKGDKLGVKRLLPPRADILDIKGEAIVKERDIVVVGVKPNEIVDLASLTASLHAAFTSVDVDVDLSDLPARVKAAKPDAFVDVVTLRKEVYDRIRSDIHELPGTVFQTGSMALAPTRVFARALLGRVGDVLKEDIDKHPERYQVGDQIGQGGLQEEYEDQLRGTAGVAVVVNGRLDTEGKPVEVPEIFRQEPKAGQPLRTTLDPKIQNAADKALSAEKRPSAIVAIRVSDGTIVAAANGPDGGTQNLAFTAQVPPGSTFKMVSALGLLDKGVVGLDTVVNCPQTLNVGGRIFKNSNNFVLGNVPFRVDFARSCNTAFASLGEKLGADGLVKAGQSVGIGAPWQIGTDAFTGSVQANPTPIELAASAFGQGQTLVSPLAMAGAAAAVAAGSWQAPKLFTQQPSNAASASAAAPAPATPLNATSVSALHTMMREAVTKGTGAGLVNVQGGPVFAKTGTAEFDNNPAHTHSWVIGWQGDIAFAVFVQGGGSSTLTAVPIAAKYLNAL